MQIHMRSACHHRSQCPNWILSIHSCWARLVPSSAQLALRSWPRFLEHSKKRLHSWQARMLNVGGSAARCRAHRPAASGRLRQPPHERHLHEAAHDARERHGRSVFFPRRLAPAWRGWRTAVPRPPLRCAPLACRKVFFSFAGCVLPMELSSIEHARGPAALHCSHASAGPNVEGPLACLRHGSCALVARVWAC